MTQTQSNFSQRGFSFKVGVALAKSVSQEFPAFRFALRKKPGKPTQTWKPRSEKGEGTRNGKEREKYDKANKFRADGCR